MRGQAELVPGPAWPGSGAPEPEPGAGAGGAAGAAGEEADWEGVRAGSEAACSADRAVPLPAAPAFAAAALPATAPSAVAPASAARSAAAVIAASRACWRWRSRPSTRADSSAAVVFRSVASCPTRTVRCALASATAFTCAALAWSACALSVSAVLAASSAARRASAAAAVSDSAAAAVVSAAAKALLRPVVRACSVAALARTSPVPVTRPLSSGLSPPFRYRSPASCPTALRLLDCSLSAAAALAVATAAASDLVSSSTRALL